MDLLSTLGGGTGVIAIAAVSAYRKSRRAQRAAAPAPARGVRTINNADYGFAPGNEIDTRAAAADPEVGAVRSAALAGDWQPAAAYLDAAGSDWDLRWVPTRPPRRHGLRGRHVRQGMAGRTPQRPERRIGARGRPWWHWPESCVVARAPSTPRASSSTPSTGCSPNRRPPASEPPSSLRRTRARTSPRSRSRWAWAGHTTASRPCGLRSSPARRSTSARTAPPCSTGVRSGAAPTS